MIELKNVKKIYKTKSGEVNALDGVSLTLPEKGLIFISGKSGCGKTTFLNVIGGLDGIDQGEISIYGKNFSSFSQAEYDGYRNTFIGFVFQEYNLLPEFTVEKNIRIAMEIQGKPFDDDTVNELLRDMDILNLKNRKPTQLSGGQCQRVAIARALAKQPHVIMADEPTGALDNKMGKQVLDILKKLSKEKLVIVVSHDTDSAEQYADRIIQLSDGKVISDITFSDRELDSNVSEKNDKFIVKNGCELTAEEKDSLADAIKNKKKIEFIDKFLYREKKDTVASEINTSTREVKLKKSKMKVKSSIELGVKALAVKPLRLIFTILLSTIAFAVFGMFDTVASFSTKNVLNNLLSTGDSTTASVYSRYIIDNDLDNYYNMKLSQDEIARLEKQTGYSIKGIYDFSDNALGSTNNTYPIIEIASSTVIDGQRYYSKNVTGIVEFTSDEINQDGQFKNFNYKLVLGEYPKPIYIDGLFQKESVNKIAISTYLADSIIHYLDGKPLNEKTIKTPADLLDTTITINGNDYVIVGLVDCGEIPEKYDVLRQPIFSVSLITTLTTDFNAYINSGAQKCIFAPDGFLKYYNAQDNGQSLFYGGTYSWSVQSGEITRSAPRYVYSVDNCSAKNVILLAGETPTDGTVTIQDNQILVHAVNIEMLYSDELKILTPDKRTEVHEILSSLDKETNYAVAREKFAHAMSIIDPHDRDLNKVVTINKKSTNTKEVSTKQVKVVGVFFGVDTGRYAFSTYRLMMNDSLMEELNVYSGQGEFSRLMFNSKNNYRGSNKIAELMCETENFSLVWYGNNVISTITENETLVKQASNLFLYIALILASFSMFMLFNYIATSIVNKRPSIGVLRGLGSGKKDIMLMFISESIIIAIINAILATILSGVGCILINYYVKNVMNIAIPFALFSARQGVLITVMSILSAILSSALPITKIAKEKPVSLIRRP